MPHPARPDGKSPIHMKHLVRIPGRTSLFSHTFQIGAGGAALPQQGTAGTATRSHVPTLQGAPGQRQPLMQLLMPSHAA